LKPIVGEWLKAAWSDLMTMQELDGNVHLTHIAAFHAQQAVEKTMKAVLEAEEADVPKVHALYRLRTLLPEIYSDLDEEILLRLDELYIESRYPGELGLLPDGRPTPEDVARFRTFAHSFFERVCHLLGIDSESLKRAI